jgi:hypothetical protein
MSNPIVGQLHGHIVINVIHWSLRHDQSLRSMKNSPFAHIIICNRACMVVLSTLGHNNGADNYFWLNDRLIGVKYHT